MRFEITQRYQSSAADVTDAYADPELYPTLVGLPKLGGIEVLSSERDGDTATLRIRFRFTGNLPSAVTAVVDPSRLTWVQETTHDLAAGTTTFRLAPDHYPDRLQASGTFRVSADGEGSARIVTGELKVRALLVGGKVEQAIVSGLAEYLVAEAPAVDAYLGA
ncbi:MAG: hypothetical protein JWM47_522 [Acidimicrobiales bacterium]|nr:hypothetical protein [Acidimicrobiales bacterium]